MEQINYANARSQFSKVMERVLLGYAVKITRKEKDAVVLISEKAYLEYKNAMFELNKLKKQRFFNSQLSASQASP
ncbi:hypothetical protein ABNIH4_10346 [Acinetobacter baumannii ABNIH4]|uniref:type II toxin-antitoxin system Phd/YefM family antitoxin n=1 Tax=Acinetobacter baumannii TaxID=470 RepID=UPI00021B771D|nr:type II toxin-antitoxin system Phd/YefM family antitoxin [Acinetobacter baumannii]EGU01469.1 hypothetical protein ABNIH4_10346 [Acinetobacter baumannii ABNIH4]